MTQGSRLFLKGGAPHCLPKRRVRFSLSAPPADTVNQARLRNLNQAPRTRGSPPRWSTTAATA